MFSTLIGNEELKNSLRRLLESKRVPGSLLFTGNEGVGKKLFALEFAKALNCRTLRGVEACDSCSSCKRISQSTFPPFGKDEDDKNRLIWSEHADVAMVRPYKQIIRVGPMRLKAFLSKPGIGRESMPNCWPTPRAAVWDARWRPTLRLTVRGGSLCWKC